MTIEQQPPTLVVQTAFLGDVILTTPLLSALAERQGPVDVVVTPPALELLAGHPAVRDVIGFDKRGRDRGLAGLWRMGRRLRQAGYARVYLPHRSIRSAALAWLARIPERIGFADSPGAWTYTRRVVRPAGVHEVERLMALAGARGEGGGGRGDMSRSKREAQAPPVRLGITNSHRRQAAEWLRSRGVPDGFVALAPGSVWATKRWPYYRDLAARLDGPIVIIGGPEDAAEGQAIAGAAPGRAVNAAGALPLAVSAALLERARVLVTNDSAPLHLATAAGTPIVAIFGPTVPAFGFGPRGTSDRVVEEGSLSCRPCSHHGPMVCPLGHHRCMREIGVERVIRAATRDL